ncbi:MAG: hypothetical protein K0S27_154 [Gammaproteobacteria bacterium]|jgi:hypothetical protein|nr:hypothetical protein [Gammaproteobacteria bacterium]
MQNIDIQLKPSNLLITLISLIFLGSSLIILSLPLCSWVKSGLMIGTLAYGAWVFWFVVFMKSSHSIRGLQLLAEGSCKLVYPFHTISAEIQGDSTVTTGLCVLRFSVSGKRWKRSCVIFNDSLDRERYRQLLVWLAMRVKMR